MAFALGLPLPAVVSQGSAPGSLRRALLLNASREPLCVVSVHRAVSLVLSGKAVVLESDGGSDPSCLVMRFMPSSVTAVITTATKGGTTGTKEIVLRE